MLRVASPGGSYVASGAIWRQVALSREAGKPVIVSMGDVAASGGYFVSMGADAIVAEPGTLTGSIGVVAGKQVIDGLVERFGIGHDGVAEGNHALMFSSLRAFSDEEWQRLDAWLDRIYEDFTGKVATGRRLPVDRLDDRRGPGVDGCRCQGARPRRRARRAAHCPRPGEGRAGIPESVDVQPGSIRALVARLTGPVQRRPRRPAPVSLQGLGRSPSWRRASSCPAGAHAPGRLQPVRLTDHLRRR